jgi:hypothetical protein
MINNSSIGDQLIIRIDAYKSLQFSLSAFQIIFLGRGLPNDQSMAAPWQPQYFVLDINNLLTGIVRGLLQASGIGSEFPCTITVGDDDDDDDDSIIGH